MARSARRARFAAKVKGRSRYCPKAGAMGGLVRGGHRAAVPEHLALVRGLEEQGNLEDGRFSRPGRSSQHQVFPRGNGQADPVKDDPSAPAHGHIAKFQHVLSMK